MGEWKEIELGEVTTKIGSGATPRGGSNAYKEEGISLIRSQNVLDLQFSTDGLAFIDEDQAHALKNVVVEEKDILLNITGDSVARACMVPNSFLPARVNQHVSIIRADRNKAVPKYLLYNLIAQKEELLMQSEIGATRKAITKGMLEQFELKLPKLPEQTAIASVLSSLDDKIDLLHRQNQTLEQMAETLFREWFQPPQKLRSAGVEEADEGWEEGVLDDVLSVKGGTTPSTKNSNYWNGNIHWTSPRDITTLNSIYLFDTDRKITEAGLKKISSGLLPKGTLLMSSRAPVGVLAFSRIPIAINQGYIAVIDDKGFSKEFIYLWLKINMDYVQSFANGSTFLEISKSAFRSLQIVMPPEYIREDFQKLIEPKFNKILENSKQIQTLTQLRDTLLPKLMSGEIRVSFKSKTTE